MGLLTVDIFNCIDNTGCMIFIKNAKSNYSMIKKYGLVLCSFFLFFGWSNLSFGQQDAMYTQYMFNTLAYNPAYAGSKDYMSIDLLHRQQWLQLEGAPNTQVFNIHSPLRSERIGLGFSAFRDQIGPTQQIGINASYAYRIPIGKGKLALGLQGGITNWRSDFTELTQANPNDPVFQAAPTPVLWLPNFGAGVYYSSNLFYVGASIPRILDPNLRTEGVDPTTQDIIARQYRHFYLMGGVALKLSQNLVFKPSFLIKNVGLFGEFTKRGNDVTAPSEYDIDIALLIREVFWIGTSYRAGFSSVGDAASFDSVDFLIGIHLKNGLRIGAGYDYTLTKLRTVSNGSYEVMIGYDFFYEKGKVVTPRYF